MIVPGALMFFTGIAYYRLAEDTPDGRPFAPRIGGTAFWEAALDYRVWLLFFLYGACFVCKLFCVNPEMRGAL